MSCIPSTNGWFSKIFFALLVLIANVASAVTCPTQAELMSVVQPLTIDLAAKKAQITLKNTSAISYTVYLLSYRKFAAFDTDSHTYDGNDNGYTILPGQELQLSIAIPACNAKIVASYKVNSSCGGVVHAKETDLGVFCEKCEKACPTPVPTPTPQPPTCDAGGPYSGSNIVCSTTPVNVALDGSKSVDAQNIGVLTYEWSSDCPGASFNDATLTSPIVTVNTAVPANQPPLACKINLKVTSSNGLSTSCGTDLTAQPCIRDCKGTINGTATVDRCGTCEGNGSTCLGCDSVNIQSTQLAIDSNTNALRDIVLKTNAQLKTANGNAGLSAKEMKANKNFIASSNTKAEKLYREVWSTTYTSFPAAVLQCTSVFCVSVSNASSKSVLIGGNNQLLALIKSSQSKVKSIERLAKKNKAKNLKKVQSAATKTRKLVNQATSLKGKSEAEIGKIPASQSSCN